MGKGGSQTIGYRYSMKMHDGICRGPIDEFAAIEVGGRLAWPVAEDSGAATSSLVVGAALALIAGIGRFSMVGTVATVSGDPDTSLDGQYQKQADGSWVRVVDTTVTGGATDTTVVTVNAPNLFGGDKGEGGIQGNLYVLMGKPDQTVPVAFSDAMNSGGNCFRGVVSLLYDGLIASMNPYPKPWRFRLRRSMKGWQDDNCWYPEKATIWLEGGKIRAMNPAHIIYECLTNKTWGRGLSPSRVDENSFIYAANTLCAEGFGLCFYWARQEDIDVFVQVVVQHIGCAVYVDPLTGLYTIRLFRGDYDPDTLPVFDYNSGLVSVEDDQNPAGDETINEVIVTYKNPLNRGKQGSVRAQNLAGFQSAGAVNSTTADYPGLPTADLANRVASRDLKMYASSPKRLKVTLDKRAWRMTPGMVFKVSVPSRNIGSMILRAGEIERGDPTKGQIVVSAVQDVFGMPETTFYGAGQSSSYVPPNRTPAPAADALLFEAGYRDLFLGLTSSEFSAISDTDAHVLALGDRPTGVLSTGYDLFTEPAGGSYAEASHGDWAPNGTLSADIGPYDTTINLTGVKDLPPVMGQGVMIESADAGYQFEVCEITSYDPTSGDATITRGCADTVPHPHAAGSRIWIADHYAAGDTTVYTDSEVISGKLLTRTATAILDLGSAPAETVTMGQRFGSPYPPGNVRANALQVFSIADLDGSLFDGVDIVLTWAHRDRVAEADVLVDTTGASIGPEPGTTYDLRVYDTDGTTLLRTVTGITAATYTYTLAMQATDGSPDHVIVELESRRDGFTSWQKWRFKVPLADHVLRDETGAPLTDESGATFLFDEGH